MTIIDDSSIATGGVDGLIKWWNYQTGKMVIF